MNVDRSLRNNEPKFSTQPCRPPTAAAGGYLRGAVSCLTAWECASEEAVCQPSSRVQATLVTESEGDRGRRGWLEEEMRRQRGREEEPLEPLMNITV